ncbi:MAG TPA: hypothetical protein VHY37_01640 [Tepidisphaeraceae bacterium]|nr:hypothetical protein [Tepidisphaeraceae bacterium]
MQQRVERVPERMHTELAAHSILLRNASPPENAPQLLIGRHAPPPKHEIPSRSIGRPVPQQLCRQTPK